MFRRTHFLLIALFLPLSGAACQPSAEGGSESEVVDPTDPAKPDPQVQAIVRRLTVGSAAEKANAAEEAAQLGSKALPATEALCAQIAKALPKVSSEPLDALETIDPRLFSHVRAIVTAPDDWTRAAALREMGVLGRDGRAALPVVTWYLEQGACIVDCLGVLGAIAPGNRGAFRMLVEHLEYKAPTEKLQHTEPSIIAAAAKAIGAMAAAEPAWRKDGVQALMEALDGPGRLEAIRALAQCGPEAKAAETQIKALRYDPNSEVQQAVDATLAAIRGYVQAEAKIAGLGNPPDARGLAQCASGQDGQYVQQLANERMRKIDPQLERLSLILFRTLPEYQDYSSQTTAELEALTPLRKEAGPWAAALVDQYAARGPMSTSYSGDGWKLHRAAYATLARIAPEAPEVRRSLLAVCQMHIDRRREPLEFDEVSKLPHYWTGGELVAIAAEIPEVERALCSAATVLTSAARIHYPEYNTETATLLNTVLGNLAELAKMRPEARKNIAAALVEVMRRRSGAGHTASVDDDALEAAFLACGAEAYAALQVESFMGRKNFSGWEKRAVEILRKTRPEGDAPSAEMRFAVGDQVWKENGGWLLNVQVVEVLAGRYLVRSLDSSESWVTPDQLREPTLPVPHGGYRVGDAVEVLVRGQWLSAKVGGSQYGLYWATLEGSDKTAQPSADEIRPRTGTAGAAASMDGRDETVPSPVVSPRLPRRK